MQLHEMFLLPKPGFLSRDTTKRVAALSSVTRWLRRLPGSIQKRCPLVPSILYQSSTFVIRLRLSISYNERCTAL